MERHRLVAIAALVLSAICFAEVHTFGVLGDAGMWNQETRRLRDSIRSRRDIKELILPGDNLYNPLGSYHSVWSHWSDFTLRVVAIGNHFKSYREEVEYFDLPGEYYTKRLGGDVRFVVLNSDNVRTASEQARWFRETMAAASEELIAVVFHHPPYTISRRHEWEERRAFHEAVRPLLREFKNKIDLLVVGHDHLASLVSLDGMPMVVSGASFEALSASSVDYRAEDGVRVSTEWLYRRAPHWTRLDFDTAERHIWINFVDADADRVVCSVRLFEGNMYFRDNCQRGRKRGKGRS